MNQFKYTGKHLFNELTPLEVELFARLTTPSKIQDFLETIPINFEEQGDTFYSPRNVLRHQKAHCFEGAMLAAAALRFHNKPAWILDLQPFYESKDVGHAVALLKERGMYGAISKTNHAQVRYRDPVYRSVRELVMSYFHECFLDDGVKNLRAYAVINTSRIKGSWVTDERDLWYIDEMFNGVSYKQMLPKNAVRTLRKADPVEIEAGKLRVWKEGKTQL